MTSSAILAGMARGGTGLKSKSNPSAPIVGFTSRTTVMLDLDDMGYPEVKYWALETMKKFRLREFAILQSSERRYHYFQSKIGI